MSSIQHFDLILKAVVHPDEPAACMRAVEAMKEAVPDLSFSPFREADALEDCAEAIGSAIVDQTQKECVLSKWDNDWDESEERDGTTYYWAYAFNTKMFCPELYYLELEFRPRKALG